MRILLGGAFTFLFGFMPSAQQRSKPYKKEEILMITLSTVGLMVCLFLFSTVFLCRSNDLEEDNNWKIHEGTVEFLILLIND